MRSYVCNMYQHLHLTHGPKLDATQHIVSSTFEDKDAPRWTKMKELLTIHERHAQMCNGDAGRTGAFKELRQRHTVPHSPILSGQRSSRATVLAEQFIRFMFS